MIDRDDTLIAKCSLTTAGFVHSTEKVIRAPNNGLPIEAFIHRWKTQRTETYTDSEGRTQTRTVTDNHSAILTAITMPFSFPLISVGGGWGGKKIRFESEKFNDRFTVRTDDAKFASDVIHPRTMEYGSCADFAHEFFSRVPSFVWKNLQIPRLPSAGCLRFSKWVRSFTVEHWPVGEGSRRPKPERSALQGDRPGADMTARRAL